MDSSISEPLDFEAINSEDGMPITYWLQLMESTELIRCERIRELVAEWLKELTDGAHIRVVWSDGMAPTVISVMSELPLNIDTLLQDIQSELGEDEYLIFAETLDKESIGEPAMWHFVSKHVIGRMPSRAMTTRSIQHIMLAEEDLEEYPL